MRSIDSLCLELTAMCPLRCVHCSANASPWRRTHLALDQALACLATAGPVREVYLSGGEPFIYPHFLSVVQAARAAAPNVVAYSSGISCAKPGTAAEPLESSQLSSARAAGLTRIDFSLYAGENMREVHDGVTQVGGSLVATIASARRAIECGLPVGVHYVPVDEAEGQLPGVAALSAVLGVVRLHVLALSPQGRAQGRVATPSRRSLAALEGLMSTQLPFELVVSSELRQALGRDEPTSRDSLHAAFVDCRGFVYPDEGHRSPMLRSEVPAGGEFRVDELFASLPGA